MTVETMRLPRSVAEVRAAMNHGSSSRAVSVFSVRPERISDE